MNCAAHTLKGKWEKEWAKNLFPLRIELRTFRVLSGCDNHYTTETLKKFNEIKHYKATSLI